MSISKCVFCNIKLCVFVHSPFSNMNYFEIVEFYKLLKTKHFARNAFYVNKWLSQSWGPARQTWHIFFLVWDIVEAVAYVNA